MAVLVALFMYCLVSQLSENPRPNCTCPLFISVAIGYLRGFPVANEKGGRGKERRKSRSPDNMDPKHRRSGVDPKTLDSP